MSQDSGSGAGGSTNLAALHIVPLDAIQLPFASADLRHPPVVCMMCGCLVENTVAGLTTHRRWHDILTEGGIGA